MGEPFLSFLNRWNQMILVLTGESVPPPPAPALPGHVHRQPWRVPDDEQQLEREMQAAVIWWALAREVQRPRRRRVLPMPPPVRVPLERAIALVSEH
jgi:hypothetical protein